MTIIISSIMNSIISSSTTTTTTTSSCLYIYIYIYTHTHVTCYIYIYIYTYIHTYEEVMGLLLGEVADQDLHGDHTCNNSKTIVIIMGIWLK